jgi:hypothetical protein
MIHRRGWAQSIALCFCALLASGCFSSAAGQSNSTTGDHPVTSNSGKQSQAPDKPSVDNTTPQKPGNARKVITNDDIDAAHARARQGWASSQKIQDPISTTGICDEGCAYKGRQQMGYGPEREGEWQIQLAAARRNLGTDTRWRQVYFELNQAAQLYCTFVNQQRAVVLPTGNNYPAAYERAERQQYATNMGRTLWQKLSNASASMNRLIEETRELEPVRAAMMSVLASRQFNLCQAIDP